MVIFVEYSISKEFFIKHKNKMRKILYPLEFGVSVLKFEQGMSCNRIAKKMGLTVLIVRRLLSLSCKQIRKKILIPTSNSLSDIVKSRPVNYNKVMTSTKKNNYYISKDNFERNKKAFKILLKERDFEIASMRWEQEMKIKPIAEKYGISGTRVRQLLAKVCYTLHKNKYEIDGEVNRLIGKLC